MDEIIVKRRGRDQNFCFLYIYRQNMKRNNPVFEFKFTH